jgi:ATP-dependent Clp protease adaptor protein ClpS
MTPHESTQVETAEKVEHDRLWNVIVWDDPINLMTYVVYVFQKIFGYSTQLATKLMKEVHESGKSLVATEEREQAELHVSQLHQYGLQATMERQEY